MTKIIRSLFLLLFFFCSSCVLVSLAKEVEIPVVFRNELPYEVELYWEGQGQRFLQGNFQTGDEKRMWCWTGHIFSYDDTMGKRHYVKVPQVKTEVVVPLQAFSVAAGDSVPDFTQDEESELESIQMELQNRVLKEQKKKDDIPDILVLICTQSFTGEELVEDVLLDRLDQEKAGWTVKAKLVDEASIDWTEEEMQQQDEALSLLNYGRVVLVVASTYADGDPPNHANEFADWLARVVNTTDAVTSPPFAVFGLGDSGYAHYNEFGKFTDYFLAARGGKRLLQLHKGDALGDQSGEFRIWCDRVAAALSKVLPGRDEINERERQLFSTTGFDWRRSAIQPGSTIATLTGSEALLEKDASRSVLHVSITLPNSLCPNDLQPGDNMGIYPRNSKALVERAVKWLGIDASMNTKIMERQGDSWVERVISASELLTAHVDLAGRATPSALRALLPFVGTLELRALARDLTFVETKSTSSQNQSIVEDDSEYSFFDNWVAGRFLTKMDLAELFECRLSLQAFARSIGPMQPRLYSIATLNQTADKQTVGLCISIAEGGLCSNFVENLAQGSGIMVFLRKSKFHFIPDGSPTLMVGAGSGIGPYMGFLEREMNRLEISDTTSESPLSHTRIFFGCRSPSEILYKDRLAMFESAGSNVHFAFSRVFGQQKIHAQDLVTKEMEVVWKEVFEERGRVFICGRLELCDDVKEALVEVAGVAGGLHRDDANQFVYDMEREGRLLTDCWSVESSLPPQPKGNNSQLPPHVIPRLERHHASEAAAASQEVSEHQPPVDLSKIPAWPSYLRLKASGEYDRRIANATNMYSACVSCGRFCEVDRISKDPDDWGECRVGDKAIVFDASPHFGEEDCLRGTHGSGTIFFGACNLKCVYCQNWKLSAMDSGQVVDDEQLADMMIKLQDMGCHNINFVSPTHNVLAILRGVYVAIDKGLRLPIVWNTGGYDSVASLRLLEGIIDIYMPDAKYASRAVARKLSKIDNYPEINQAAIKEMHRQVGDLQIDPRTGLAYRGVLVRHLVLPGDYAGTNDVATFLVNEVSVNTFTHINPHYRPEYDARADRKFGLNRKPTGYELDGALEKAKSACLQRIYQHGRDSLLGGCPNPEENEEECAALTCE